MFMGPTRGRQGYFFLKAALISFPNPPCVPRLPKFGLMLLSAVEPAKPLARDNFEAPV